MEDDMELREIFSKIKIIPVCVFDDVTAALKTTEILLKYKVEVIEVTLRTVDAFECIYEIKKKFPQALVGAGSVFDKDSLIRSIDSGGVFGVAPCFDEELVRYALEFNIPFIPGVATPSELHNAARLSSIIKLFPAQALGGVDYLNSITAPFRKFKFDLIPAGGIDNKNYKDYLSCEKVLACGLTYPVSEKLLKDKDYSSVEKRIIELYGEF